MFWKALDALEVAAVSPLVGSVNRGGLLKNLEKRALLPGSLRHILGWQGESGGGSSVRTGMGARVHFVSILRITPRVVGGGCVRDVECILLFMMLQSTVSESSALESYGTFAILGDTSLTALPRLSKIARTAQPSTPPAWVCP